MNLIGKGVVHRAFGKGTITQVDGRFIWIDFEKTKEKKRFSYPDCFTSFLTLEDATIQIQLHEKAKENTIIKQQEKKERLRKEEAEVLFLKDRKDSKQQSFQVHSCSTVDDFCQYYQQALAQEVAYLRVQGGKQQRLMDGRLVEMRSLHYIYSFEAEDELHYPDGTAIHIWFGQDGISGKILECLDFTVIISAKEFLGEKIDTVMFSAEPWQLLEQLGKRLWDIKLQPSELVQNLICQGKMEIGPVGSQIQTGQEQAVEMSVSQPITFVWGPPGTGKTQTLAKIALRQISEGNRVLMLSYSNVSVDGAIQRVQELADFDSKGILIRYGYPRQSEILEHPYLTSYQLAIHNHLNLERERRDLIQERKKYLRESPRYVEIGAKLHEIKTFLKKEEVEIVHSAKFVATTVSKAIMDRTLYGQQFDVVIFDEASMAYIPQIVFAASLAKSRFICMGDFMQLPPIVQSKEGSALQNDIFEYCGIAQAVADKRNHNWLCLLDTQYRMHPQIAEFASQMMYHGLLKSAPQMRENREKIVYAAPAAGHPLAFADLTGMMSVCLKTADQSRVNILSAFVSASVAVCAAKTGSVGVITPYKTQARLLHAIVRDLGENNPRLQSITCATVHQFQGSEMDTILYDAVDCYRMPYPGTLLLSNENNKANRLFNVALTRARGKFIGVANMAYMSTKKVGPHLMFGQLMAQQYLKPSCLTPKDFCKPSSVTDDNQFCIYNIEKGNQKFGQDLLSARKSIHIDIPKGMNLDAWDDNLVKALEQQKRNARTVIIRAECKKELPHSLQKLAIENPYVANPLAIIDKRITWFGEPASKSHFIAEGHTLDTPFHPIYRFEGPHTAAAIYNFAEMNQTMDQSKEVIRDTEGNAEVNSLATYILATVKCSACGKPMRLQKNRKGVFFLSCVAYPDCQGRDKISLECVEKYLATGGRYGKLCPKCHCSLEAKLGAYGVYVQCCGGARHRYRLDEI